MVSLAGQNNNYRTMDGVTARTFDWLMLHTVTQINGMVRNHGKENTALRMLTKEEETRIGECTTSTDVDIQKEMEKFLANRNIFTSHHQYLQNSNSFLIEVGGGIGDDVSNLVNMYNPKLVILEPIPTYADKLKKMFESNSRVTVLNFGLGKRDEFTKLDFKGNNTVNNIPIDDKVNIEVKDASNFFKSIRVGKFDIDLLILDCEGCELDVLEDIIESDLVKNFKNIQIISAHARNTYAKVRYCEIQELLSRTHRVTFQYKHVAENWRRNDLT